MVEFYERESSFMKALSIVEESHARTGNIETRIDTSNAYPSEIPEEVSKRLGVRVIKENKDVDGVFTAFEETTETIDTKVLLERLEAERTPWGRFKSTIRWILRRFKQQGVKIGVRGN